MRETNMEKLIELLNEWYLERYGGNPHFVRFQDFGGNDYGYFRSSDDKRLMIETEVWTKKYGFIKRLVENEKVEFAPKPKEYRLQVELENGSYGELGGEARLLMLLSIQDNPIEFLISILK